MWQREKNGEPTLDFSAKTITAWRGLESVPKSGSISEWAMRSQPPEVIPSCESIRWSNVTWPSEDRQTSSRTTMNSTTVNVLLTFWPFTSIRQNPHSRITYGRRGSQRNRARDLRPQLPQIKPHFDRHQSLNLAYPKVRKIHKQIIIIGMLLEIHACLISLHSHAANHLRPNNQFQSSNRNPMFSEYSSHNWEESWN